jgi:hypothetical protein
MSCHWFKIKIAIFAIAIAILNHTQRSYILRVGPASVWEVGIGMWTFTPCQYHISQTRFERGIEAKCAPDTHSKIKKIRSGPKN